MNDQKFEQWLRQALATDVTAPEDFTARVMDRVSAMPQEYPKKNTVDKRKLKRMMTALAACAAIVVLIPVGLMMMPMGKSAPAADGADCAAPEMAMDDAAADMEYFVDEYAAGSDSYNAATERMEEEQKEPADGAAAAPTDDGMTDDGETEVQPTSDEKAKAVVVHLFGDEAAMVRTALTEMGRAPDAVQDIADVYELTAAEADALRELVPDVIKAKGALYLTLEVAG
ncbi:MAG: hypothetical protein J6J01_01120 [Oscillospiraceae bacterium]|nr:hypothetical protein [Oscillospiraceae bacterium]